MGGLIPAIVQDNNTSKVLMLGFMNQEAYDETVSTGKVTFFSRTKNRLWEVGQGVWHSKARKIGVGIPENRSQQIEKLFGLERKIVWRRLYGHIRLPIKAFVEYLGQECQ